MFLSELSKQACSRSKTISFSSHPSAPAVWGGGEAGGTGAAGCRVRCGAVRRGGAAAGTLRPLEPPQQQRQQRGSGSGDKPFCGQGRLPALALLQLSRGSQRGDKEGMFLSETSLLLSCKKKKNKPRRDRRALSQLS